MISFSEVLVIHDVLVEQFGGAKGIRDSGILASAINRPYQTFDQIDLYPDPIDKASAIFESIISNHPFVDGNKRTAYVLMRLVLHEGGYDINATENEKYNFVIQAAQGELSFDGIKAWIKQKLVEKANE